MPAFCPSCGGKLPEGDAIKFCPACGHHLVGSDISNAGEKPANVDAVSTVDSVPKNPQTGAEAVEAWGDSRGIDLSKVPPMPSDNEKFDPRQGPMWENARQIGRLVAFGLTIRDVIISPVNFFQAMRVKGGLFEPMLFAILVLWIAALFNLIWSFVFPQDWLQSLQQSRSDIPQLPQSYINIVMFIVSPIITIISIFLNTAIFHLSLLMLGGAKKGFEATFRVMCYSGAAAVFNILPVLGPFLGVLYVLTLDIIGLREAHEIGGWKAFFAIALPLLLICGCCCAFIFFLAFSLGLANMDGLSTGW